MGTQELVVETIFLPQSVLGILGNFFLLSQYLYLEYKLRPTDVIVKNLIVANLLAFISGRIRDTLESFGRQHISDLAYRLFPYIHRVGRGMSISITCLLSVFQAITISHDEGQDSTGESLFTFLLFFVDAVFLGLMLWAHSFMVFTLYRHKQRVQHLHRSSLSSGSSPESRATQTILLLASTFLCFYTSLPPCKVFGFF
ncbi:vomeronasal type-1 receptor 2-like [Erinaceus europaeus]|uniref:Vomeronasal type-1 receptor n=1 Tax=Erinaceus europaeus TaxID=9365 RepID=A0ABM3X0S1_ERIEU|nr:vomeronasal type-1 receptor 2-like [Erinaceus europaeus]